MIGGADAEGLVQLGIEHPLAVLVGGVAGAHDLAARRRVEFIGVLVGLGDLVVQAPLDVVGDQRIQAELMVDAEALAGDGVVPTARLVVTHSAKAWNERAADSAQNILVSIILVMLVGETQAGIVGVFPAQLGQHVGGAHVFRVGLGARQARAAVATVGLGLVAVALAQVQQAVEVTRAACHRCRGQPAVIGRAVAGLEARADILAWLDDVVRVEGEVAHRAADGVAAVQHGSRAAKDFHALDDLGVDVIALGLGIGAVEEAVGDRHAVYLGEHALAVDAADVVAVQATALAGTPTDTPGS